MAKLIRNLRKRSATAVRGALHKLETRILVAQGRKAVRRKAHAVAAVTRKAARAGLVTGGLAAAGVVTREIRKRRRAG
jgi:hypothetical protein